MADIADITPGPGERSLTFGGTRAGKSALDEWRLRQIQHDRPSAMIAVVDSKPRFRAETERGPFRRGRKSAAHRYETWSSGPMIPGSVVVDIWDEKPFKGIWDRPGEIAILQGGTLADWKRMLHLLNGYVAANIKGRERLIYVDECLDFTVGILGELIPRMMCFIELPEPGPNGTSVYLSAHIECMDCHRSSFIWRPESHFFICGMTLICAICALPGFQMPNPQRDHMSSANGQSNQVARFPTPSLAGSPFRRVISGNCRIHRREGS